MTKIDIFSGFLGAGKTTLIKKLIAEAYEGEKLVLIENEFGEIGIDGGFLKDSGIEITEMNQGCICCSLVGDFAESLGEVLNRFSPDRIIIEPSGVGKLSDVIKAVKDLNRDDIVLNGIVTVADAKKCKMYIKNFGEFFCNQIENAKCIVLSHTKGVDKEKLENTIHLIKEHNKDASLIVSDWDEISGELILKTIQQENTLDEKIEELKHEHHHHHDEECCCGHHHDHEHHHHYDEECCCGHHHDHEHHHHHDEECCCGHHHDHEHHHHADEVFASWGIETAAKFTKEDIENALKELENEEKYGIILRAKGIVATDNNWIHFDYVPGEADIREGSADVIGRICVIGSKIKEEEIAKLFEI